MQPWLAAMALCALASMAVAHESQATRAPSPRANPAIGVPFSLQDPQGRPLTELSFRGRWLVAFFGYTRCPDVCPTTLVTLTRGFELLGPEADKVNGLFVTLDPQRDRPDVLRQYMANFSPRITAATGTPAQTDAAAKVFRVRYEIEGDVRSGSYTISHPVAMLLFDPQGRFVSLIPGGASAEDVRKTLVDFMRRGR
jgi:protein SCO1